MPTATSTAISPALDPAHHSPNPTRPGVLAAAAAELPLERGELIGAGRRPGSVLRTHHADDANDRSGWPREPESVDS
jgi:hypothetical protein